LPAHPSPVSGCEANADCRYGSRDTGYKPTAKKTIDEYAALDAEDESLARWKASLGIGPGGAAAATATGPNVRLTHVYMLRALFIQC